MTQPTVFSVGSVLVSVLKPRFCQFHGTSSGTSVLVPTFQTNVLVQGPQGVICIFFHFGASSVPFRCGSNSGGT